MPALPGAATTAVTSGQKRSFQTIACSRAPLPTTSTRIGLLPLDGGRRLRGDVVHHAVDPWDLVHDAGRHDRENVEGDAGPVGSHGVFAGHRANRYQVAVGSVVAHHAYRPDRRQHRECLPDLIVETG